MNLHPKISEYTFISSAQGIFSRIKHILGYKGNLNKLKSIEIISNIFSGHNGMKLEINHRERNEKKLTTWRSNASMRKSGRKLKNILRQMIMKTELKSMGCCKSSAQREVHSNTGLPQKKNKNLKLTT